MIEKNQRRVASQLVAGSRDYRAGMWTETA